MERKRTAGAELIAILIGTGAFAVWQESYAAFFWMLVVFMLADQAVENLKG